MTRTGVLALGTLLLSSTAFANTAMPADIMGSWMRQDGATRIDIAPCGTSICAINTWVRDPSGSEKVGDTLVMTLAPDKAGAMSGHALDVRRDMTFSMDISLAAPGMRTRGCTLMGILCKSAEWVRVK